MAVKRLTLQTHLPRPRPKWTFSNAVKEIDRERDGGQPYVPGLMSPRDDSGNLRGGCPDYVCPEDIYPEFITRLVHSKFVVADAVEDGSNFKTPAPSRGIKDVWYDDLMAAKDVSYSTPDNDTITPAQPLTPGTKVKVRFEAY